MIKEDIKGKASVIKGIIKQKTAVCMQSRMDMG